MTALDATLQPLLARFGVSTPDQLPADARAAFDKGVGWLNAHMPDDHAAAAAVGLGSIAVNDALGIARAVQSGDALGAFNQFALSLCALVPEVAPFIGIFVGAVDAVWAGIQAAGLAAHGADDPCAANGAKWFGNVNFAVEDPPTDPKDARWTRWDQDGSKGVCGYHVPGGPQVVDLMRDAIAGHQTPFDQALATAWAHALELYANAKGPFPGPMRSFVAGMRDVWNATHAHLGNDETFYAKRPPFGARKSWQQFHDGAWHDVPPPKGGPFGWGSDFTFTSWMLGEDDSGPDLELTVNGGPLVPELAGLVSLKPKARGGVQATGHGLYGGGVRSVVGGAPAPAKQGAPTGDRENAKRALAIAGGGLALGGLTLAMGSPVGCAVLALGGLAVAGASYLARGAARVP